MKKILKKGYLLILVILMLFTTSCKALDFINDLFGINKCEHEYIETIIPATCTTNGKRIEICSKCNDQREFVIPKLDHDYKITKTIDATCTTCGYVISNCTECDAEKKEETPPLGHSFDKWKIVKEATIIEDGYEERECNRCHYTEKQIIKGLNYIDLDLITFDYDKTKQYEVQNINELALVYHSVILNRLQEFTCILKFEVTDLNELLNEVKTKYDIGTSYKVSVKLAGNGEFNAQFTYEDLPSKSAVDQNTVQLTSLNFISNSKTRSDTFDDFKINSSLYSYEVTTSDQLFYCLERRVKPLPVEGSMAEVMYERAKDVLRNIVSDNMSEIQKIKAIHDWVILNVTYDNDLYERVFTASSSELKSYNGFYLEGVFLDKIAVCEGISKAVTILLNIEGIPCVQVTGYQTANPNGAGHAWNKVFVNNKWYILDATSDNPIINNQYEILSYEFFLINEETMQKKYTGTNYQSLICDANFDYYGNNYYKSNDLTTKLTINNRDELLAIVKYFKENSQPNSSIQFKIVYNFNSRDLGGFSYIDSKNQILTLINVK